MTCVADHYSHPQGLRLLYVTTCVYGKGSTTPKKQFSKIGLKCDCFKRSKNCDSSCPCNLSTPYVGNKLNTAFYGLPTECSIRTCPCAQVCGNILVQRGPCASLEIVKTQFKGMGVVTKSDLEKGSFICEFAGEWIGTKYAVDLLNCEKRTSHMIILQINTRQRIYHAIVDAFKFGNIGRYINHSCDPNSILVPVRAGFLIPMICIFAARDIKAGEEITYDYNPFSNQYPISENPCMCKTLLCRKLLPRYGFISIAQENL